MSASGPHGRIAHCPYVHHCLGLQRGILLHPTCCCWEGPGSILDQHSELEAPSWLTQQADDASENLTAPLMLRPQGMLSDPVMPFGHNMQYAHPALADLCQLRWQLQICCRSAGGYACGCQQPGRGLLQPSNGFLAVQLHHQP